MLSSASVMPTIPASDIDRAKKFYSETLGLESLPDRSHGELMFKLGGGTVLSVYKSGGAGTSQATYASFKVDDLEPIMDDLRAKGVVFEEYDMPGIKTQNGVVTDGDEQAAWFKDSEGNILCLNKMS